MENKYDVTDAELEIMKVLWKYKTCTLTQIVDILSKEETKNKSTVKTLLYRLIDKGAVVSKKTDSKVYEFKPNINEKRFLKKQNESFIKKLYNGQIKNLLFNFVEEKQVTKEDIKNLLDILEKGE